MYGPEPELCKNWNRKREALDEAAERRRRGRGLVRSPAAMPESMDERIAREKKEKYEASDEYAQLQADEAQDKANVALASGAQLSESDIAAGKAKKAGDTTEQARQWIADVTGLPVEGELGDALKSGVLLCEVVNKVNPGHIRKISKSAMPFPQRENIKAFTDAVRDVWNVPDRDNFETGDLFEQGNMKQVVICILSVGAASKKVPGYSGPTITTAGSGQKTAGRSRQKSKVTMLGAGLNLNLGGPPPAEPGSMEWMRQQKEAKEAGGGGGGSIKDRAIGLHIPVSPIMGGGGGGIKARGAGLNIPLGMPPGMSPRTPTGAGGGGGGAAKGAQSDETATPKLALHPTSARASRGKRQAATRRPRKKAAGSSESTPTAAAETPPTPAAAATPRRSVNAAPTGALLLPMFEGGTPTLKSTAAASELEPEPAPSSPKPSVTAAPAGAFVLPKLPEGGGTLKKASSFVPRSSAAKAAGDSPPESAPATKASPPAGALVLLQAPSKPALPPKKEAPKKGPAKKKPPPKPKFVPPEGINPDLTMMYELEGDPSEEIGLEDLQRLVDKGEVGEGTRVWSEGMEDWATFDGACWRFGHGERTLIFETEDEEPSEETPMARVQELVDAGTLNGATRVWSEGMEDWADLTDVAAWLALSGVEAVEGGGGDEGEGGATTFIYDTDGDGTPSDETSVSEIDALIEAGTINDETMVWSDGWDDWASLAEGKERLQSGSSGGGGSFTTFVYDTDGDGTPSDEVSVSQIDALIEAGTINDDTMVWSDGWDDWASLSDSRSVLV